MGRHQWQNLSRVATSLGLFLIISFLLSSAKAENRKYPTANNNLNPMQAWRSAEFCLQNTSSACQTQTYNYTLTDSGWLNVSHGDGQEFCGPNGCAVHTRAVILCIYHVKKDYVFANHATVQDLNDTINFGCDSSQGFTGISRYSHSSLGFRLNSAPIFTAVSAAALLFIAFF